MDWISPKAPFVETQLRFCVPPAVSTGREVAICPPFLLPLKYNKQVERYISTPFFYLKMDTQELYELLREGRNRRTSSPTLDELAITREKVNAINAWARDHMYGAKATYIPELASEEIDANKTAIAIGDLRGNRIVVGDGHDVVGSVQSVIKPFLYLYALSRGVSPDEISGVEANALPFNADQILRPELQLVTAQHPLNNAGAISSAGAIKQHGSFDDFLSFMQKLTRNSNLGVLEDVFRSEMATNANNAAIAYRLVAAGRFQRKEQAEKALENYTRACSIGVTVEDLLYASFVLASGGLNIRTGERLVSEDAAVRAMNAMNSFGMYEETGRVTLLVAGARANTCKSGVGGYIINVNPDVGAFVTYNPLLNKAGNSVYGLNAMIPLNELSAAPGTVRLSVEEMGATRQRFEDQDAPQTCTMILGLIEQGFPPSAYRTTPRMIEQAKSAHEARGRLIDRL